MESSPLTPEDDSDKKSSGKKKKKSTAALGVFATEPDAARGKRSETADDIWQSLKLTKRRAGRSEEAVPLAQIGESVASHIPEASEVEAPLEALSQSEQQFAAREVVMAQRKVATEQPTEHELANSATTAAVELFRDKVVSGQDAEQAFAETLQSLSGEPEPAATASGPEELPFRRLPGQAEFDRSAPDAAPGLTRESASVEERESITDQESGSAAMAAGVSAGFGGEPPPRGPRGYDFPSAGNYFPPTGTSQASRVEKAYIPYYNNEDVVGAALLGGLIDYFIGRRRGRIKTEKKLRPIQKKLEKQVKDLQEDIVAKEFQIRKVAHQQPSERRQLQQSEKQPENMTKDESKRVEAPEANQLHSKKMPVERIGRVLVTAEYAKPNVDKKPAAKSQAPKTDRRAETMNRAELLAMSEQVAIENTTLRQVYETHLVGEQGLRRLIDEHVRGGDVRKALHEELIEHEIDFERDPILRGKDRTKTTTAAHGTADTLSSLLQKAGAFGEDESREELAVLKARQAHHDAQRHHQQTKRLLLDVSMAAAIAVLFVLVVMLLIRSS